VRRILVAISDNNLLDRIKLVLGNKSSEFFYTQSIDDAKGILSANKFSLVICDLFNKKDFGEEFFDLIGTNKSETKTIMFFGKDNTKEALDYYNRYSIFRLLCTDYFTDSEFNQCFYATSDNNEECVAVDKIRDVKQLEERYLRPMREMSSILNERLIGYQCIVDVFRKSFDFAFKSSEITIKTINGFVDKVINDYIRIYMIEDSDINVFFNKIEKMFNKPEEKKYFKFLNETGNISEKLFSMKAFNESEAFLLKCNIIFSIDVLTTCFDNFYPHYRGKIVVNENDGSIEINTVYEVRRDHEIDSVYKYVMAVVNNILISNSKEVKNGVRDNVIQYKVVVS